MMPSRLGEAGGGTAAAASGGETGAGAGVGAYVVAASFCVLAVVTAAGAGLDAAFGAAVMTVADAAAIDAADAEGRVVPHCTQNFAVGWVS